MPYKCPKKKNANARKWEKQDRQKNPEKYLYYFAKERSRTRGIECTITPDDLSVPSYCPVLDVPLDKPASGGDYVPSIHRIDSNKGYTPDNVMVVSLRANMLMNNGTLEEFEAIVRFLGKG